MIISCPWEACECPRCAEERERVFDEILVAQRRFVYVTISLMKQRVMIIILIMSVFILGVLFATAVKHRQETQTGTEMTVVETPAEEAAKPEEVIEAELKDVDEPEAEEEQEAGPEEVPEEEEKIPLPRYNDLLPVNPYVAGWLEIDDSVIDVPVVYTPGSQNYFLHRDIEGKANSTGTLFIAIDWEDGYNNTLIYGHNMKDGSGFGSLQKFSKESYGKAHPVIHFDTLYEEKEYELYAAFFSQIDEEELETEEDREEKDQAIEQTAIAKKEEEAAEAGEEPVVIEPQELTLNDLDLHREFYGEDIYRQEKDEDNGRFRYYYFTDLSRREDFDYYAEHVKENALYDTGVQAEWGDEFITLSTCSYQVRNGRFVVVGVRKK